MINVSIIGGSGYSGKELIRLLLGHPEVKIKHLFAKSSAGKKLSEVYPVFYKKSDLSFEIFEKEKISDMDIVFLALPHGDSMQYIPELAKAGKKVIDLGGDFRFKDPEIYEKWYKVTHTAKEFLNDFVYGLPELYKEKIIKAKFIANPGCYPTSAILALAPILNMDIFSNDIIINSLSGVSGAGRKATTDYIFCEVNETVKAYKIGNHQHSPEIQSVLEDSSNKKLNILFTPHLIPVNRGIYSTIYLTPAKPVDIDSIRLYYKNFYEKSLFVRMVDVIPQIQSVTGTNFCDIYIEYIKDSNKIVIISTLDNLIKGAAGQAIQNMNLLFNFKEDEGINGINS
jgi:N-acetyl-gamma-glutamyl-phosphate reductase